MIGPPSPAESWFWLKPCAAGEVSSPSTERFRSRSEYVKFPCAMLVPLRVVEAICPPENCPRATS
jgi:hypothetical protein